MQEAATVKRPATYRVEDLQQILGIGRNNAYNLIKQDGFPHVRVGTRIVIPVDLFHEWLQEQARKGGVLVGA